MLNASTTLWLLSVQWRVFKGPSFPSCLYLTFSFSCFWVLEAIWWQSLYRHQRLNGPRLWIRQILYNSSLSIVHALHLPLMFLLLVNLFCDASLPAQGMHSPRSTDNSNLDCTTWNSPVRHCMNEATTLRNLLTISGIDPFPLLPLHARRIQHLLQPVSVKHS